MQPENQGILLFISGVPGTGKSTSAQFLAREFGGLKYLERRPVRLSVVQVPFQSCNYYICMFGFDMLLIEWDIIHQLTNIIFAKMHYFKIVGGFLSLLSCVQCCTVQYAGTTLCYIELTDRTQLITKPNITVFVSVISATNSDCIIFIRCSKTKMRCKDLISK